MPVATSAPTDTPSEPAAQPLLQIDNLHVSFSTPRGRLTAVNGLSLEVSEGETVAVLGESGSGKSVTAQTIMGLLPKHSARVDSGQVRYRGVDLLSKPTEYTRKLCGPEIAMVFQDPLSSLNPVFRVGQQIGEMLRRQTGASRREAREHAISLMRRVGIPAADKRVDDFPHQFSGGMRQRVMIAMALSRSPRLLIADEPTTALDVTVQAQIMALLAELQEQENMALLLITHDLGVVADVADRAVIMYAGNVAETGTVREVYDHGAHPYGVGLLNSVPDMLAPQERLTPIDGSLPDLLNVPSGCPFHPRCPLSTTTCGEVMPPLRRAPGRPADHLTACHHAEELLNHE